MSIRWALGPPAGQHHEHQPVLRPGKMGAVTEELIPGFVPPNREREGSPTYRCGGNRSRVPGFARPNREVLREAIGAGKWSNQAKTSVVVVLLRQRPAL